jgi:hypothetical protein
MIGSTVLQMARPRMTHPKNSLAMQIGGNPTFWMESRQIAYPWQGRNKNHKEDLIHYVML